MEYSSYDKIREHAMFSRPSATVSRDLFCLAVSVGTDTASSGDTSLPKTPSPEFHRQHYLIRKRLPPYPQWYQ